MPLTGPQIGRIHKAILAAYDYGELRQVVRIGMDERLETLVSSEKPFRAQVFELIEWADRNGRVVKLLSCICDDRPDDAGLAALHAEFAAPLPPAAPPPPAAPHQIFLSYSHKDGALKDRLLADLTAAGLAAWTDDGLEPGTPEWQRAIEQAIRDCRCLVAILSPDAKQSKWVNIEIGFASRLGRRIFPALVRGDDVDAVPIALFNTQYVDLRTDFAGQVRGRLLPALRRHLGKSAAQENPPPTPPKSHRDDIAPPPRVEAQPPAPAKQPPIEFDWVTIPAGEFFMGSDKKRYKLARDDELPQHRIRFPEYRIARVPVTNAQYVAFVQATGHSAPSHWKDGKVPQGKEQHPVVRVNWQDARAFCAWASEATSTTVRLPSEAEWEKSARGADGRIWPWGNDRPREDHCNFNGHLKGILQGTAPVDAYPRGASPYGVLDMAGNVWEWTGSLYRPYPYDAADGREDPEAKGNRTLRGGAFSDGSDSVRCAFRYFDLPDYWSDYRGFRVVSYGF